MNQSQTIKCLKPTEAIFLFYIHSSLSPGKHAALLLMKYKYFLVFFRCRIFIIFNYKHKVQWSWEEIICSRTLRPCYEKLDFAYSQNEKMCLSTFWQNFINEYFAPNSSSDKSHAI